MPAKKKTLQKFTDIEKKINKLLELEQISYSDYTDFNKDEMKYFQEYIAGKLNTLKGEERDVFLKKFEKVTTDSTRNELWQHNHVKITVAISTLMQEYGRMPAIAELLDNTGLSRQTIHKHLKEYSTHPLYLEQIEQFRFMTSKVLAKMFQFAVNGDVAAAKLFFNVLGNANGQQAYNTLIQNQNNYIQINGTVLSQETIKHLNAEQLNTIETILKTALPQTA